MQHPSLIHEYVHLASDALLLYSLWLWVSGSYYYHVFHDSSRGCIPLE